MILVGNLLSPTGLMDVYTVPSLGGEVVWLADGALYVARDCLGPTVDAAGAVALGKVLLKEVWPSGGSELGAAATGGCS